MFNIFRRRKKKQQPAAQLPTFNELVFNGPPLPEYKSPPMSTGEVIQMAVGITVGVLILLCFTILIFVL